MIASGVFKPLFTYEYWVPVVVNDEVEYRLDHSGSAVVIPAGAGGSLGLVTDAQLSPGSVIRNLKDRAGTPLLVADDVPYDMYVHTADFALDLFSRVSQWRHTLRRTPPRDFEALLERAVQL